MNARSQASRRGPSEGSLEGEQPATRPERVHWLDWLRLISLFGVFVFHALHPFDQFDWHVKNREQSEILSLILAFLFPWGLGLFFLLAGAGAFFSLRSRCAKGYLRERVNRILVPLVVAYLLLSPLQAYIEALHKQVWSGSFTEYVPVFFREAAGRLGSVQPLFFGRTYHLWFLVFLLWYAIVGLPWFRMLATRRGRRLTGWLTAHSDRRGSTLFLALPIVVAHVDLRARFPDEHDWGEFAYYLAFFLVGYLLVSQPRLLEALRRDLFPCLVVGAVGFTALIASGVIEWVEEWTENPAYSWTYAAMFGLFSFQAWGWAAAALSVGMRVRSFQRPLPQLAADMAMPFFLLHQPVILLIAYFAVQMDAPIWPKLVIVFAGSFLLAAALAYLLSRGSVGRLLTGMKRAPGHREALG